jgi:uncharacterized membrane protein
VDEHCRITVVGECRQVDLAVPARAPIATYVDTLARVCAQERSDILPPAWSLATATAGPFAPEQSLAELGIVDGQVLYLRDVIAQEFADPVVYDVGERVTEVAEGILRRRWDPRTRTMTVMAFGLGWLIATLIVLASRHHVRSAVLLDFAVASGLVLPALAWMAAERPWPVPPRLREILALSAVPALALAARTLATTHLFARMDGPHAVMTAAGLTAFALAGGAMIGAFLAFSASPGVSTCAVLLAAVLVALLGGTLAMVKASGIESAAITAAVAYGLLTIAPRTVSRIVTFAYRSAAARLPPEEDGDPVATAVRAATTLLVCWSGGLAVVLAVALVPLAASRSPYAAAEASCLSLALLLRAGSVPLVAEVLPVSLAGTIGLFTLLLVGPGRLGWRSWTAPVCLGLIAGLLLIYGFRRLMRRPELPSMTRPRWLTSFSSVLAGAGAALAVGPSGVFSRFVEMGHHL